MPASRGGTGRSDGASSDVYLNIPNYQGSALDVGCISPVRILDTLDLNEHRISGTGWYFRPVSTDYNTMLNNHYPIATTTGVLKTYRDPTSNTDRTYQEFLTGSECHFKRVNTGGGDNGWGPWKISYHGSSTVNIYVSKDGDDKNSGCSPLTPIQTLSRLYSQLSDIIVMNGVVTIYFGPGDWGDLNFSGTNGQTYCIRSTDGDNLAKFGNINIFGDGSLQLRNIKVGSIIVGRAHLDIYDSVFITDSNFENSPCILLSRGASANLGLINFEDNCKRTAFIRSESSSFHISSTFSVTGSLDGYKISGFSILVTSYHSYWNLNVLPGTGVGDGTTYQFVYSSDVHDNFYLYSSGNQSIAGNFSPATDNTYSLGTSASDRWKEVYATTGTIQTSDSRVKTDINNIPESVFEAWGTINFKQFKFTDAVEEKGLDKARLHIGLIAQDILEKFQAKGLDATKYGLICKDTWESKDWDEVITDKEAVMGTREVVIQEAYTDESGQEVPAVTTTEEYEVTPAETHVEHHHIDAGDRYSLRYDECLALECAYQRWMLEKLAAKLG